MPWVGFNPGSTDHLPAGLVRGLSLLTSKQRRGEVSVTELVAPTQIATLRRRHDYTEAPDEMIWAIFGKAVHEICARGMGKDELGEEEVVAEVGGVKVSGTPDLWDATTLYDYKTCSVYKVRDGAVVDEEWRRQLGAYRLLLHENGFKIEKAQVVALFRDYRPYESKKYPWYPPSRIWVADVILPSLEETRKWMEERLERWEWAQKMGDRELSVMLSCTPEETWETKRCQSYCPVSENCYQWGKTNAT